MLAANIEAVIAFLSNIFLVLFAFSIADMGVVTAGVLNWLYIPVFVFPFLKIVI